PAVSLSANSGQINRQRRRFHVLAATTANHQPDLTGRALWRFLPPCEALEGGKLIGIERQPEHGLVDNPPVRPSVAAEPITEQVRIKAGVGEGKDRNAHRSPSRAFAAAF